MEYPPLQSVVGVTLLTLSLSHINQTLARIEQPQFLAFACLANKRDFSPTRVGSHV